MGDERVFDEKWFGYSLRVDDDMPPGLGCIDAGERRFYFRLVEEDRGPTFRPVTHHTALIAISEWRARRAMLGERFIGVDLATGPAQRHEQLFKVTNEGVEPVAPPHGAPLERAFGRIEGAVAMLDDIRSVVARLKPAPEPTIEVRFIGRVPPGVVHARAQEALDTCDGLSGWKLDAVNVEEPAK